MKTKKKNFLIVIIFVMLCSDTDNCHAADLSVSASSTSIYVGDTVTVWVKYEVYIVEAELKNTPLY